MCVSTEYADNPPLNMSKITRMAGTRRKRRHLLAALTPGDGATYLDVVKQMPDCFMMDPMA
jgi:hypothetical protein